MSSINEFGADMKAMPAAAILALESGHRRPIGTICRYGQRMEQQLAIAEFGEERAAVGAETDVVEFRLDPGPSNLEDSMMQQRGEFEAIARQIKADLDAGIARMEIAMAKRDLDNTRAGVSAWPPALSQLCCAGWP